MENKAFNKIFLHSPSICKICSIIHICGSTSGLFVLFFGLFAYITLSYLLITTLSIWRVIFIILSFIIQELVPAPFNLIFVQDVFLNFHRLQKCFVILISVHLLKIFVNGIYFIIDFLTCSHSLLFSLILTGLVSHSLAELLLILSREFQADSALLVYVFLTAKHS